MLCPVTGQGIVLQSLAIGFSVYYTGYVKAAFLKAGSEIDARTKTPAKKIREKV
jgi:hypothetical protein